jgi:hypothetical protein
MAPCILCERTCSVSSAVPTVGCADIGGKRGKGIVDHVGTVRYSRSMVMPPEALARRRRQLFDYVIVNNVASENERWEPVPASAHKGSTAPRARCSARRPAGWNRIQSPVHRYERSGEHRLPRNSTPPSFCRPYGLAGCPG